MLKTERGEKLVIGTRLKVLRKSLGLTQAQMAEQLGVSSSYITLIEADQRPASAKLLMRLAQVYDLNISELAPDVDMQLASDFAETLKDPTLQAGSIPRSEIEAVLQASPRIARAFVRLHAQRADLAMRQEVIKPPEAGQDTTHMAPEIVTTPFGIQTLRPADHVRNWLYERQNYIDALDRAAENLATDLDLRRKEPHIALTQRLTQHGIKVRIFPAKEMHGSLRRIDADSNTLMLSELLGQASRRFQIGVMIARVEFADLIESCVQQTGFSDPDALTLARVSMANYFAAALLMPYTRFLAACELERYDVELLSRRFGTSFEQTAHRMSTLQRPDARGIPFFFVRVDQAGNVSKRFSAGRFAFSRFGGTCPLWNVHSAFETPGRIRAQMIRLPEGERYFSIARTINRAGGSIAAPAQKLAIGLGCDISHAKRLVYADMINFEHTKPTDIGLNCYLCEKPNCSSRAQAPINRKLAVNELERSLALYRFEGE